MRSRRFAALLLAMLTLALPVAVGAAANAAEETPQPLLVTWYRQMGWGSKMQAGYLDDGGGLWFGELEDASRLSLHTPEDVVAYFRENNLFACIGEVDAVRMAELESMIPSLDEKEVKQVGEANDAGTEYSYAFRNSDGETETILLGTSGDQGMENGSVNAQALYFELRSLFPGVYSYAGWEGMGPEPFQSRPLMEFCGFQALDAEQVSVTVCSSDCEAGSTERKLTREETTELIGRLAKMTVVGKQSALNVTGGVDRCVFSDADGKALGKCAFFAGMLYQSDGMYRIETVHDDE
ncbi:MAG: hypothetical protein PHY12_09205 [Eubacteriales bacterium]|nr:hypothetical protein [Eubacteriales bacterium]